VEKKVPKQQQKQCRSFDEQRKNYSSNSASRNSSTYYRSTETSKVTVKLLPIRLGIFDWKKDFDAILNTLSMWSYRVAKRIVRKLPSPSLLQSSSRLGFGPRIILPSERETHDGNRKSNKVFKMIEGNRMEIALKMYLHQLQAKIVKISFDDENDEDDEKRRVCIIAYKLLSSSHVATYSTDFVPLLNALFSWKEDEFVHGDIRGYNIVFSGGNSKFIDFDLAEKNG